MKVLIYIIISFLIFGCVSTNKEYKLLTDSRSSKNYKTQSKIHRDKCLSQNECIQSIYRNVSMKWVRPDGVKDGMSVKIGITVDSEGFIKDTTVIKTSGSNNFDLSCISAIEKSSPFVEVVQLNSFSENPSQKIYFNFNSNPAGS